jgi:uncharacterized protein (UPF0297 family)
MDRTLNNPGYLGAVASNEVNVEENEYIYNRSAYDASPNVYNQLSRDGYNTLNRNIGNRASGEYGYAPSRPVSRHSYSSVNYYEADYIKKLNLILPPEWFEALDPETGKIYYCHILTETTQWLHPGIPVGTIMPNGIPYGWDTAFDKNTGTRYWINHIKEYNTWVKPDCIKKQQH